MLFRKIDKSESRLVRHFFFKLRFKKIDLVGLQLFIIMLPSILWTNIVGTTQSANIFLNKT